MSNENALHSAENAKQGFKHWLHVSEILFIVLLALSLIGVGITDFSPANSWKYWIAMVPVFAGASVVASWSRANHQNVRGATSWLVSQLLHWGALVATVYLIFLLLQAGRLNNENTGLMILLVLALATFLAGVHYDWRLCLVGAFLGGNVIMEAWVEEYMWTMLIAAVILLVIALLVGRYTLHRIKPGTGHPHSAGRQTER